MDLLKKGLIYRIGDGTDVNIWKDPWMNRMGSRLPLTQRGRCLLTRVCELIDPESGTWDENLVRNIFVLEDVQVILSTPINVEYGEFHTWFFDTKGQFSLKSAYRVYVQ